jgi:hypothetical protein
MYRASYTDLARGCATRAAIWPIGVMRLRKIGGKAVAAGSI